MLQRTREIERAITRSLGRKRTLRLLLMVGGILVVLAAALTFWLRGGRFVSTDDAYVRAAKLMVSTDVSGIVTDVDVREGQAVKAGDVLFRIDPRQFQIALDNAKAQLQQTALAIEAMKQDYKRMLEDIQAQQAQVELDEAQRQLDHTVVRAPFNGIVTQVDTLQPGTYLVSQTAALTNTGAVGLVSTDNVWIDAHVKETDLTYVKPGDPVGIFVDTYPSRVWSGI